MIQVSSYKKKLLVFYSILISLSFLYLYFFIDLKKNSLNDIFDDFDYIMSQNWKNCYLLTKKKAIFYYLDARQLVCNIRINLSLRVETINAKHNIAIISKNLLL